MKKGLVVFATLLIFNIVVLSINNADAKTQVQTIIPTDLVATAVSPTQIDLHWNAPTQNYGKVITGYKIEERLSSGAYYVLVENTGSTITVYSITGLTTGKTYAYRVSAVYSDDTSTDPSNTASATPTTDSTSSMPSSSPTGQETNVKFDFTPSDGTTLVGTVITRIDYQQLQYEKDPRSLITNVVSTLQSINNNLKGILAYQNSHLSDDTVPGPLVAKAVSPTQIDLSWLEPIEKYSKVIIGYKIEWKRAPGDYVDVDDNTGNRTTKYSVYPLSPGTTYTYRVSAIYNDNTRTNPSNEATTTTMLVQQYQSNTTTITPPANKNTSTSTSNQQQNNPVSQPTQNNVKFDLMAPDGTNLNGVILTQADYQQFIVIKDPRSMISNVMQTSDTINNSLAGLIRFQDIHVPKPTIIQPTVTTPAPDSSHQDNSLVQGVATYVIALLSVGAITWFARTKIAKKISKEYHFTLEKYQEGDNLYVRIRNSGETIENSVIFCEKEACVWTDTNTSKPRHIYEGSISAVKIPQTYVDTNPLIIIKSTKKSLRKTRLDDMASG
ncbi:MAG: fibronectin type III domain-containing protein [Nitrososphaera sp.]